MKKCNKCGEIKNLSDFASDRSREDGKSYYCKTCDNKKVRNYYHRNKERIIRKRKENPDYERDKQYKSRYGITVIEYENILSCQNGVCAVCGKPPDKRRLCIDHDHKTGAVRGLLCRECNTSLGNTNDDIGILQKLINYLERKKP